MDVPSGKRIGIIGAITGGTSASARRSDIRFYPAAPIDVAGPRLLKEAIVSVPVFSAPTV